MREVNVNEIVKVKLTDKGFQKLLNYYDAESQISHILKKLCKTISEDAKKRQSNGEMHEFQLWQLANIFLVNSKVGDSSSFENGMIYFPD